MNKYKIEIHESYCDKVMNAYGCGFLGDFRDTLVHMVMDLTNRINILFNDFIKEGDTFIVIFSHKEDLVLNENVINEYELKISIDNQKNI